MTLPNSNGPSGTYRANRGDVKLAILSILHQGPSTGYEVMKKIRERSGGVWRISSGSVYPQLEALEDSGLVTEKYVDDPFVSTEYLYELSKDGKKYYDENRLKIEAVWDNFKAKPVKPDTPLEGELKLLVDAVGLVLTNAKDRAVAEETVIKIVETTRKAVFSMLAK